jgi:hypothetical protein
VGDISTIESGLVAKGEGGASGSGVGVIVGACEGAGVGEIGFSVEEGRDVGVGEGYPTVIEEEYVSENKKVRVLCCLLIPLAVIKSESKPSETPVICHVAVSLPNGKSPMLYIGELIEK